MARWDGHTAQDKQDTKDRKRAKEKKKKRALSAIAKAARPVVPKSQPKPARPSIIEQMIAALPMEVITGSRLYRPENSQHLGTVPASAQTDPLESRTIQGKELLDFWKGKPKHVSTSDSNIFWSFGFAHLREWIRKQTDVSKEIQRELEVKQGTEEFQRSLEQVCPPWSVLMDRAKKDLTEEIERLEKQQEYSDERAATRLREKKIRKAHNLFFQKMPTRRVKANSDPMVQTKEFISYLERLLENKQSAAILRKSVVYAPDPKRVAALRRLQEYVAREIESLKLVAAGQTKTKSKPQFKNGKE